MCVACYLYHCVFVFAGRKETSSLLLQILLVLEFRSGGADSCVHTQSWLLFAHQETLRGELLTSKAASVLSCKSSLLVHSICYFQAFLLFSVDPTRIRVVCHVLLRSLRSQLPCRGK